ncbi:SAF domain-containing protein [Brevibacillus ginsengisoli]|uniref:SAF domain-containing protein n=1 Tax=Brevibacillus ginsengisoli TaxID=363854 RepID=UPI003CEBA422
MKKRTLLIISVTALILALGCFYGATRYLDDKIQHKLYASVVKVAPGKEIQAFEPISREDLIVVQEPVETIQKGASTTVDGIIGKYPIQTIYEGEQIISQKVEDTYLLPKPNEARYEFSLTSIMPITELRKGDGIKVWVRYKPISELEKLPEPTFFKKENATASLLFDSRLVTVKDSNGIEIYTLKPQLIPHNNQVENPFFNASEAANLVDTERRFRDYRAQPSAVPAYIGLNLTDKEYQALCEAMNYGLIQIGHVMVAKGEKLP